MTGLERLRDLVDGMIEWSVYTIMNDDWRSRNGVNVRGDRVAMKELLCAIADQIESETAHDHSKEVSMLAYDLLPEEDRKAIAWVREKGGVNALSMGFQDADNRRIELCSSLGIDLATGWADAMAAMRRRLMPEGMEWPKVDGKPVDFKTAYEPSLGVLEAVSIYNNGACQVMSHDGIIKSAKDIHIVKPKVLDADGVEIRVGDVLYSVESGDYVIVDSIEPGNPWFATTDGALQHCSKFIHRAPVLAADGVPIKAGDEVYGTVEGGPFIVIEVSDKGSVFVDAFPDTGMHGSMFTHAKPEIDSWERVEEDANLAPGDYIKMRGRKTDLYAYEEMPIDLVRRCKALAERDAS